MRRSLQLVFLLITILGPGMVRGEEWGTIAVVPTDAIATAVVTIDDTNPSMQSLAHILLNRYLDANIPPFLLENLLFLLSGDVAVTLTGAVSAEVVDYAIVTEYVKDRLELTLPLKDVKIRLTGRDPEKMKKLYGWLFGMVFDELVAGQDGTLSREPIAESELTFNPTGEDDSNPSAYLLVGSKAILGSNSRVVKQLAARVEHPNNGLGDNVRFAELRGRIPPGTDGFIFIDNSNQRFGRLLRNYEEELDRKLLRMTELLDAMLLTFTVVDQARLTGKVWFVPLDGISVDVLEECGPGIHQVIRDELRPINLSFTGSFVPAEEVLEMEFTVEDLTKPSETQ